MEDVDPTIAKQYIEKLTKKGVEATEAHDRAALAWQIIEEGMQIKKRKRKD
ncbi:hypothetical protein TWF718_010842 [Orbilia javanica]|uniref:Uncharacterized protein n=1 Tax=Orbilia javanica TaxID=47235 RepID=A0AAN8MSS6_9PEZI